MRWSAIADSEPALGAVVSDRLVKPGVLLAGTVRRDGSPRISGVEPLVMDLARDRRILLHSIVTGPEPAGEVKVRGTVRAEQDRDVQRRYAAAVSAGIGWRPVVGEFTLFAVDVADVTYIGYDADTQGQHVARWPAGVEYVRPSVTPTSLGPPHPVRRLLTG